MIMFDIDCPICYNSDYEFVDCNICNNSLCMDCFYRLKKPCCPFCRTFFKNEYEDVTDGFIENFRIFITIFFLYNSFK